MEITQNIEIDNLRENLINKYYGLMQRGYIHLISISEQEKENMEERKSKKKNLQN